MLVPFSWKVHMNEALHHCFPDQPSSLTTVAGGTVAVLLVTMVIFLLIFLWMRWDCLSVCLSVSLSPLCLMSLLSPPEERGLPEKPVASEEGQIPGRRWEITHPLLRHTVDISSVSLAVCYSSRVTRRPFWQYAHIMIHVSSILYM